MKGWTYRAVGSRIRKPGGAVLAAARLFERHKPPHTGSTDVRAPSNPRSGVRIACAAALFAVAGVLSSGAGAANVEVEEGSTATVEVRKTAFFSTGGCRVDYRYETHGGTAQEHFDFKPISGQLTFWPRESSKTLEVETNRDRCVESDETFSVELTGGKVTPFGWRETTGATCHNLGVRPVLSFRVTIKDVPSGSGAGGSSYEDQKYGCSDGTVRRFGE